MSAIAKGAPRVAAVLALSVLAGAAANATAQILTPVNFKPLTRA